MATQKQPGRTVVPDPMGTIELFDPAPYRRTTPTVQPQQARPSDRVWLTKAQLAERLTVSERTIERKIKAGIWPCYREGPNLIRFSPSHVRFIETAMGESGREVEAVSA